MAFQLSSSAKNDMPPGPCATAGPGRAVAVTFPSFERGSVDDESENGTVIFPVLWRGMVCGLVFPGMVAFFFSCLYFFCPLLLPFRTWRDGGFGSWVARMQLGQERTQLIEYFGLCLGKTATRFPLDPNLLSFRAFPSLLSDHVPSPTTTYASPGSRLRR